MRIIGYKDIRELDKLKEWEELKKLPHFCISRTLSNGVLKFYNKESLGLITTVDKIIKAYFKEWVNGQDEIIRLGKVSGFINEVENEKIRNSFKKSKKAIYESIKTCIECGVRLEDIEEHDKEEEIHFFEIYRKALKDGAFNIKILDKKGIQSFKNAMNEILEEKMDENEKELNKGIEEDCIDKVILHGVHKFTPLILKLIQKLEENEIEVIFLINYNDEFKNLYKTWENVYKWTGVSIEKDFVIDTKKHSILSENYKNIIEGNLEKIDLDKEIDILEFEDYTELSNYIGEKHEENEKEQFYAADSGKINDILKNYYIEKFESRHFLASSEGQFILNLFNMVNEENIIEVELNSLEEALMTRFLDVNIEAFDKVKVYLKDLDKSDIKNYIKRLESLLDKIKVINKKEDCIKEEYRRISYYSLTINEVESIIKNFRDIKEILDILRIEEKNVLKKYKNITIKVAEKRNSENKEASMLLEVYKRLKKIIMEEEIEEYKEALYYLLKEEDKRKEEGGMVKDFNHIEGGILQDDKIYHFMDISDGSMQRNERKAVWPLDISLLRKNNMNLDIIKTSLDEGKNYLRYALFYGLYFTEGNVKISYIKNKEKRQELYFILKFMNFKLGKVQLGKLVGKKEKLKENLKNIKVKSIREKKLLEFCEKRFTYEVLFDGEGVYKDDFTIKKYLEEFLKSKKKKLEVDEIKKLAEYLKEIELKQIQKVSKYKLQGELDFIKIGNEKACSYCKYKVICY